MDSPEVSMGSAAPSQGRAPSGGTSALERARRRFGGGNTPPPPPGGGGNGGDEDEDGMLRMSFLEHLQELRSRIIKALVGIGVAFTLSLLFADPLWDFVRQPATRALTTLGYKPELAQISTMEVFNVIWFKLPVVCAIFIASPWVLYQVWAFISPGLYRSEKRFAVPFILSSAGLFILGGLFAYFVAVPFGLTFLLGMGRGKGIAPFVSVSDYFDRLVDIVLGVACVFEMPVVIFFLTLFRIVTPSFLIKHSRYAILIIFILAAVITPTPDAFNMMLFAIPMCALFYVGVFASYMLVLRREHRSFPWMTAVKVVLAVLLLLAIGLYLAITKHLLTVVPHWPFLVR